MGRRFGWLAIIRDLRESRDEILTDFRGTKPPVRIETAGADHFLTKVDDDLDLSLAFGHGVTLIQGQYDLGLGLRGESRDLALCKKYSQGATAFRLLIDDTSETREFKRFEDGELVQSYFTTDGEEESTGHPLKRNEHGGITEWEFIAEIEQASVPWDSLRELPFTVHRYAGSSPPPAGRPTKRWFEFWR